MYRDPFKELMYKSPKHSLNRISGEKIGLCTFPTCCPLSGSNGQGFPQPAYTKQFASYVWSEHICMSVLVWTTTNERQMQSMRLTTVIQDICDM